MIDLLLEAVRLKEVARAGWARRGHPHPESVAGHSWGVGFLVLVLLPPGLDRERALTYAILHDLPEVRVGDITPAEGIAPREKHRREREAMARIAPSLLPAWDAYEAQQDPEAQFVRQLDRLDMALQAIHYRDQVDPQEFLDSAARVITEPALVAILQQLRAKLRD